MINGQRSPGPAVPAQSAAQMTCTAGILTESSKRRGRQCKTLACWLLCVTRGHIAAWRGAGYALRDQEIAVQPEGCWRPSRALELMSASHGTKVMSLRTSVKELLRVV